MRSQLALRHQAKFSFQTVLTSQLLQLSATQLAQHITRELEENPALERADSEVGASRSSLEPLHSRFEDASAADEALFYSKPREYDPDNDLVSQTAVLESARSQLHQQVTLLPSSDQELAHHLIDALDVHGYLTASTDELTNELGVTTTNLERVIQLVQELDPPGIAARNPRECFIQQCRDLEARGVDCARVRQLLEEAWDEVVHQDWKRAARKMRLSIPIIQDTLKFIRDNLYPYPLELLNEAHEAIERFQSADLIVHRRQVMGSAAWNIEIPQAAHLTLRLSPVFQHALAASADNQPLSIQQRAWLDASVRRAHQFLGALEQRWSTLRQIGEYLVAYQSDFLEHGADQLKPLTRTELARALGMHKSTISRAVADKTIQLPNRHIVPLHALFDPSTHIKTRIRHILQVSAQPLSDREIALYLQADGVSVARRTIAKHRRALRLPKQLGRARTHSVE